MDRQDSTERSERCAKNPQIFVHVQILAFPCLDGPAGIWTRGPRCARPVLYQAELQAHWTCTIKNYFHKAKIIFV